MSKRQRSSDPPGKLVEHEENGGGGKTRLDLLPRRVADEVFPINLFGGRCRFGADFRGHSPGRGLS